MTPIDVKKKMQGYVSAKSRQRCETCRFQHDAYGGIPSCSKGGFIVTLYSVCKDWQMRQPPGFKPSAPVQPIQPADAV